VTARVQGDITTPVLLVEEGALLSGAITMGNETARSPEEVGLEGNDDMRKSTGAS
jgi:cytoskeletal protein CcmA (bactofilin family)